MRVVIIGGTRFIGPQVVQHLHADGHTLWLVHRHPATVSLPANVTHLLMDRAQLEDRAAELRAIRPDVVLDMIAFAECDALSVVRVFAGAAERLVVISSQDVYQAYARVQGTEPGDPDPIPLTEDSPLRERRFPYRGTSPRAPDDPLRWLDHYDKVLVERAACSAPDLPCTILRLPAVYGPGDPQHRLLPYLKRMDDGRQAILLNEQTARWRWTRDYVENTAAAIALAITDPRAAGRIYNLGESRARSTTEWIHDIALAAGWHGEVVAAPDYQLPEDLQSHAGMDQELVVDCMRIREELGYSPPVSRYEGFRRTVAWERANRPDPLDPALYDYATEDAILARLR